LSCNCPTPAALSKVQARILILIPIQVQVQVHSFVLCGTLAVVVVPLDVAAAVVVVAEGDRMPHFGCVVAAQWETAINEPFSESLSVFWPTVSPAAHLTIPKKTHTYR